MNFGSSVLYIVAEPSTDCCRYAGVVDTIGQLLMVHNVEWSCQIERDEYCSVSRHFSSEVGSNVGGDRRQFLPMLLSLPGFKIWMIIALCHTSVIIPVEIDILKMLER